jgi:hypothetical protein
MNLQTARFINSLEARRSVVAVFIALGISMAATVASSQQVIPFGDVPATVDFSEAEIAARGQQKLPNSAIRPGRNCASGAHRVQTRKWSAAHPSKASPTWAK